MREKVLLKANFELVIKQSKYLKTFTNDNTIFPVKASTQNSFII